ncbi:MAG: polyhydroxyalkanoic acid system family protein [Myxococcales bacterium]|nr:polyhydroxyalkanoic acid system family protein [Myxococcales bacterium]
MMHLERRYTCPDDEALTRLHALTDYWHRKHGLTATWTGSACHVHGKVKGVKFDARVNVSNSLVRADVDAGFLAEKLGGRKYVEGKLDDYLDPARSVDELRARA